MENILELELINWMQQEEAVNNEIEENFNDIYVNENEEEIFDLDWDGIDL